MFKKILWPLAPQIAGFNWFLQFYIVNRLILEVQKMPASKDNHSVITYSHLNVHSTKSSQPPVFFLKYLCFCNIFCHISVHV